MELAQSSIVFVQPIERLKHYNQSGALNQIGMLGAMELDILYQQVFDPSKFPFERSTRQPEDQGNNLPLAEKTIIFKNGVSVTAEINRVVLSLEKNNKSEKADFLEASEKLYELLARKVNITAIGINFNFLGDEKDEIYNQFRKKVLDFIAPSVSEHASKFSLGYALENRDGYDANVNISHGFVNLANKMNKPRFIVNINNHKPFAESDPSALRTAHLKEFSKIEKASHDVVKSLGLE